MKVKTVSRRRRHLCVTAANAIATGVHAGPVTRLADAALSSRYLLVKPGTAPETGVAIAGATDIPLGIALDEAASGEAVAVALLGAGGGTLQAVASATIVAGDLLVPAANGLVQKLPATTGSYYIVGRALAGAAANEVVPLVPTFPILRTV